LAIDFEGEPDERYEPVADDGVFEPVADDGVPRPTDAVTGDAEGEPDEVYEPDDEV
jgi:hypothetical protein